MPCGEIYLAGLLPAHVVARLPIGRARAKRGPFHDLNFATGSSFLAVSSRQWVRIR